jgi:hypothetical protein
MGSSVCILFFLASIWTTYLFKTSHDAVMPQFSMRNKTSNNIQEKDVDCTYLTILSKIHMKKELRTLKF